MKFQNPILNLQRAITHENVKSNNAIMRNPSMNFQNPFLNFEQTEGRTQRWTSPKQYAPKIFQSWGHNETVLLSTQNKSLN